MLPPVMFWRGGRKEKTGGLGGEVKVVDDSSLPYMMIPNRDGWGVPHAVVHLTPLSSEALSTTHGTHSPCPVWPCPNS